MENASPGKCNLFSRREHKHKHVRSRPKVLSQWMNMEHPIARIFPILTSGVADCVPMPIKPLTPLISCKNSSEVKEWRTALRCQALAPSLAQTCLDVTSFQFKQAIYVTKLCIQYRCTLFSVGVRYVWLCASLLGFTWEKALDRFKANCSLSFCAHGTQLSVQEWSVVFKRLWIFFSWMLLQLLLYLHCISYHAIGCWLNNFPYFSFVSRHPFCVI